MWEKIQKGVDVRRSFFAFDGSLHPKNPDPKRMVTHIILFRALDSNGVPPQLFLIAGALDHQFAK
jgi:hypothetical protein